MDSNNISKTIPGGLLKTKVKTSEILNNPEYDFLHALVSQTLTRIQLQQFASHYPEAISIDKIRYALKMHSLYLSAANLFESAGDK